MTDELQAREFTVDIEADLDLVWEALTTRRGLMTWFVVDAEYTAEPGGRLRTDWGTGMLDYGDVDEVDAPHRIRLRYPESEEWVGTEEWLLSHDDGVTHVRLIHSLPVAEGATWEGTFGDIVRGWNLFLATMRFALERTGTLGRATAPRIGDWKDGAWPAVLDVLGAQETPSEGTTVRLDAIGDATVLRSFEGNSVLLAVGDDATLMIDVEGPKLYTLAAVYPGAEGHREALLDRLTEVAEKACAAGSG